ncbi:MAG TPA: hypothetical protein VIM69_00485 [Opitutaceae bacterium]
MKLSRFSFSTAALLAALKIAGFESNAAACSVCGCSLSSDWAAQGYQSRAGFQTAIRYEYYDQSQLRSGTGEVDRASLTFPNDDEVQQDTINRNLWLDLNYVTNQHWGIEAQIPYYNRSHTTIAEGDTDISSSHASGMGDIRLLGRWQTSSMSDGWSVQAGLKLPTGRFNQDFATGPQAGELLDRGLQLGTGTTDALVGISYFIRPTTNWSYFAQVIGQRALDSRDGFRPGSSLNVNLGIRRLTTGWLTPQLQLNARWDARETGPEADYENSGDFVLDVSPGLTADINMRSSAFVFVQLPVFQKVNGLQLEPKVVVSIGFRFSL